jgi:uncharacterized membrane protein YkoI
VDRRRKLIVTGVAALALLGIGTGVVVAAAGDDDEPLEGNALDRASAAALEAAGGGEVIETEVGDDGAAYGVEIRKADGSVVEVNLDQNFQVIGQDPDDDGAGDTEGPGDDD